MDKFVFLLELIGTVAFAASGSLTAIRRHMDLLGVIVLGVITSVGGGILRDVILGITPPLAFRDPTCTLVAVGVSLLLCIPWIRHSLMHNHRLFDVSLLLMDSVGLGVFTVMGIWNAMDFSAGPQHLSSRVRRPADRRRRRRHARCAGREHALYSRQARLRLRLAGGCGAGAPCCGGSCRSMVAMLAGMTTVLLIRLLSAHFRWNLPRVEDETL